MARKTANQVTDLVLAYGSDPRNHWFTDPHNDETAAIQPAIAALSPADFTAFFNDFTQYIRVENGMGDIIMTGNGLKQCPDWASLALYVFNLQ